MTTPVIGRADDGGAKIKRARAADPSPKKMKKDSAMKMKKMDEGVKKTKKEIRKENRADRKKSRDYKKYSQLNPKNPDRD